MRRVVNDVAASTHAIGELMLEVALAYLSDIEAADVLALLCERIGEPSNTGSLPAATDTSLDLEGCEKRGERRAWLHRRERRMVVAD
ncbi:hypothetical protein [Streptomyces antibioticus]|uniref:hypothetical protein n=1 Tax=Streptomyces antibioticus TaxID=1890 RepID=UPI003798ABEA